MIFMDNSLLTSQAFNQLKSYSVRVLIWFLMKQKLSRYKDSNGDVEWRITNNGELVFTYAEAEKRDMSRKRFSNAIKDLIDNGFLEVTHHGTEPGSPSTYLLTERWRAYGTKHFKPVLQRENKKLGVESDTRSSVENDTSSKISTKYPVSIKTPDIEAVNAISD